MNNIRQAEEKDISRIAEMIVFNYRINFFPFFKNEEFYFKELNVIDTASEIDEAALMNYYVYDDGAVKGMLRADGNELVKLYVDPAFQSCGIGKKLISYAVNELKVSWLWVLEYNRRGMAFYKRNGFEPTGEKMLEDGWIPLLKMKLTENRLREVIKMLETERLILRELTQSDYNSLCAILQDNETMYAYEGAFTDEEVQDWLDRQIQRYNKYGFGLWAVVLKENGEMIGQCGLTMQPWKDTEVLEIGYLFNRNYWHKGYAAEAAAACKRYAFEVLDADEVCSIIRDTNTASRNVAKRNGMTVADTWTKHYRGVDMPHCRFVVKRG